MHEAALAAEVDPDRLSFTHALRVLQAAIPEFQMTAPEQLPRLYRRVLRDIARKRLPARRPRSNPRAVKRKMSNFRRKRPGAARPPQPSAASWREAVALCSEPPRTQPADALDLSRAEPREAQLCRI